MEREAGPALDTQVANVVFGHQMAWWRRLEDSPTSGEPRWERCDYGTAGSFWVDGDPWGEWKPDLWTMVPPFSTEGSAMLMLIERMRALGYWWEIATAPDGPGAVAVFTLEVGPYWHGRGDSPPHAVALAALAALEGRDAS